LRVKSNPRSGAQPEVTRHLFAAQERLRRPGFRSVSPAPNPKRYGSPEVERRSPNWEVEWKRGDRSPTPPPGNEWRSKSVGATSAVNTRLRASSTIRSPKMETLTRLVSESLARHGFDRPLDYRRLHWSRWFRCESHHSLLTVPSKPGVFAIAE